MKGGSEGRRRNWIFDVWKRKVNLTGWYARAVLVQVYACAAMRHQ